VSYSDYLKRRAAFEQGLSAAKLSIDELIHAIDVKLTVLIALNIAMVLAAIGPYLARLFS